MFQPQDLNAGSIRATEVPAFHFALIIWFLLSLGIVLLGGFVEDFLFNRS